MTGARIFRLALRDSLPVLMGYTTMGFVAGVLLAAKGNVTLAPLWGFLSSALWVTGTMSIAGVPHIAAHISAAAFALMTLAVNFRYAFYGFSMLGRWKDVPFLRKCYLILMLTDENYALEAASPLTAISTASTVTSTYFTGWALYVYSRSVIGIDAMYDAASAWAGSTIWSAGVPLA